MGSAAKGGMNTAIIPGESCGIAVKRSTIHTTLRLHTCPKPKEMAAVPAVVRGKGVENQRNGLKDFRPAPQIGRKGDKSLRDAKNLLDPATRGIVRQADTAARGSAQQAIQQ